MTSALSYSLQLSVLPFLAHKTREPRDGTKRNHERKRPSFSGAPFCRHPDNGQRMEIQLR